MEVKKDVLEVALRRQGECERVARVIKAETVNAVGDYQNFMSCMLRVKMEVVLGSGRVAKRTVILKTASQQEQVRNYVQAAGMFKTETEIYRGVLRKMEVLMEEYGDTDGVLWCKMLHYLPYSSIFLEDLQVSGFRMFPRQLYLDLDHTEIVLRSLGRFHGMGKALEERGIISPEDHKPFPITNDPVIVQGFVYGGVQTLRKVIQEYWGPEWKGVAEKLNIPLNKFAAEVGKVGIIDKTKFNCLNHGDCWSNNFMYKYDYTNRPSAIRFVDMQCCHYNTPTIDLLYFLYSSTEPQMRREKLKYFVETWRQSLMETMSKYNCEASRPSCEQIMEEMKALPFMRLSALIVNIGSRAPSDIPQIEMNEVLSLDSTTSGHQEEAFRHERVKAKLGPDLIEVVKDLPAL